MKVRTCCKINLGLNVVERRPDGYHNLQTIFYPVPLFDEIAIEEGEGDDDHSRKCRWKRLPASSVQTVRSS